MCYSVKSSIKTTLLSLFAIIYLLSSGVPHFQWIAVMLIGWCGMQFDELLLWLTNPRKRCTLWNKVITLTLIPIVLMLQVLGPLFGSLYVIPWDKSSNDRKNFIIYYSSLIILAVLSNTFINPYKFCTIVTPKGHLDWTTTIYRNYTISDYIVYYLWFFLILLPILLFWNVSFLPILLLAFIPTFGFLHGLYTDGKPSIWCYYTSYTSIVAIVLLALYQLKIFDVLSYK
jgi:hypothetical protein